MQREEGRSTKRARSLQRWIFPREQGCWVANAMFIHDTVGHLFTAGNGCVSVLELQTKAASMRHSMSIIHDMYVLVAAVVLWVAGAEARK